MRQRSTRDDGVGPLEREEDVDERGQSLHHVTVLGVVDKESLAALVCGVPFEYIKDGRARRWLIGRIRRGRATPFTAGDTSWGCRRVPGWWEVRLEARHGVLDTDRLL